MVYYDNIEITNSNSDDINNGLIVTPNTDMTTQSETMIYLKNSRFESNNGYIITTDVELLILKTTNMVLGNHVQLLWIHLVSYLKVLRLIVE